MLRSVRFLLPVALAWLAAACSDAPTTAPAADGPALSAAGKPGVRDRYIVLFDDRVGRPADEARELVRAHGGTLHFTYEHAVRGFAATLSPQAAEALRRNPNVRHVEPDGVVTLSATQTSAPWGLDRTDQRALPRSGTYTYTAGATGQGVNAYVVDTGIRFTHTQFGGRAVPGADFVLDGMNGDDCIGHGTHVAGILGGSTYGVAKAVKLYSVRVFDCVSPFAYTSAVVAGLDWVRSSHVKPAVVNMSFNGYFSLAQDDAVKALLTAGVTVVSSAGNDNTDVCEVSSAWIDGVIAVGATDSTDTRWGSSNWGHCMDVFAPGADIRSAMHYDDTYTEVLSGTSMAAPHVAGAVARYLQTRPSATPAEAHAFIVNNATTGVVSDPGLLSPNRVLYVDPALGTPTTSVTGPSTVSTAGTYTWAANAGSGNGTYTYAWQYRVQGSATWTSVGTGSSYSRAVAAGNPAFELRVTVTSGGVTATDNHLVAVTIPNPPNVTISGATTISAAGTSTWTASATGGTGTYTYAWEYRVQGSATWTAVGTGSSYSRSVAAGNPAFELRVTATSGGLTDTDTHLVAVAIPTQPNVTITGTTLITTAGTSTWTASVTGGNGTNTYLWEYRLQGGTGIWATVGTTSSYSRSVSATHRAFELRVTVTSGGLSDTDTHLVSVNIPTPLAVNITGPSTLTGGTSGTWYAGASGGSGSYIYQWQYRTASVTTWSNVNQTSSYTRTAPLFQSFYVRVTVTSGTVSVSDEHYVAVEAQSQEPVMCGNVYC